MFHQIQAVFSGIYQYYASLTGVLFVAAILKLVLLGLTLAENIFYRLKERLYFKKLIKSGIPADVAKRRARDKWRPKPIKKKSIFAKSYEKIFRRVKK